MGTFGSYPPARDNWFWSNGLLDNQAWGSLHAAPAAGRIQQLTAYMAGDSGAMTAGPALWDSSGNLLLYTATAVARRSGPYSGGFDGTGRNPNDGYDVNVYGFSYPFSLPASFYVGMFRQPGDSWIIGFDDTVSDGDGRLRTVNASGPSNSGASGNTWATETGGYRGTIGAYATFTSLGLYVMRSGVWVQANLKYESVGLPSYRDSVMADSPLAYLPCDEGTGLTAADATGNRNGTLTSAALWHNVGLIAGSNYCINGDGSNYITLPKVVGGPGTTHEFWFRIEQAATIEHLFTSNTGGADKDMFLHCKVEDAGVRIDLYPAANGGSESADSTGNQSAGAHHFVMTNDGAGTIKLYIDGALVKTISGATTASWSTGFATAIGAYAGTFDGTGGAVGSQAFLSGHEIGHVAWYSTVLSTTRIAEHYNAGVRIPTATAAHGYARRSGAWQPFAQLLAADEMPEAREFPAIAVWPDGTQERALGIWHYDEPSYIGSGWQRKASGLIVPRPYELAA